ncbi:MAG: hypothetical protein ACOX9R_10230 [Armatimonadota bacterium]|jgi:hypothetical protein
MQSFTSRQMTPLVAAIAILLCAGWAAAQSQAPLLGERPAVLDPNAAGLPDSSLVDFSGLLEGPCGTRGRLFTGRDGNFYFEDGSRGRFWGINVAKGSVFQPPERIREAVDAIARAGFNLVRLHHIDDVEGLLPPDRVGTANPIDPEALSAVDHWIAECGKRGIYVYLDLLDFRTFYEREGVPAGEQLGRGAKPYALFNERLIELQMQYAKAFLIDHVNPLTGLSYADDPTVCMIELCDENGLFAAQRRRTRLLSPYRDELQRRWNFWLRAKYEDTESLRIAWTDWRGQGTLAADESLEQGTIALHDASTAPGLLATPLGTGTGSAGRLNDLSLFMASVHRDYFEQMTGFLRERGVQQPITAVTDFESTPDLRSVYESLDFMGANYYYDHPRLKDGLWQLPMYFINHSPVGDATESFAPKLARSAFVGKPLVMREWGVCWPNKFRAAGMIDAIAYAALHDVDAMILFTYDIRPEARRLDFFDVSRDPTRWGLAAIGARVFLQRDIAQARRQIEVGYSEVDSYFVDGERTLAQLHRAANVAAMRGRFFGEAFDGQADLMVASGLSSGAIYPSERTVISAEQRAEDLLNRRREATLAEKSGYQVATTPAGRVAFEFGGTLYPASARVTLATHPGFSLRAIDADPNLRPIGRGADGTRAFGLRDMRRNNWVYHALQPEDKLRATLDAFGQLYDERISHSFLETGRFVSDTREIVRDEDAELIVVNTPTFQAIAGALGTASRATGRMSVRSSSSIGAVTWLSLDGRGPDESRRWVLKMVTIALNAGEEKSLHVGERERAIFALTGPGEAPVTTLGEPVASGTVVSFNGAEMARVGIVNGTWEIVRESDRYYVYCDTPGARITVAGAGRSATAYAHDGSETQLDYDGTLTWPENARMVTIR